ncbi:MAG: cryptochrome/photolyase family protein [Anaerolineae bacterium]|nr:cryptochrome/photolyase family protein [Anaerolineae bacterium]
MSCLSVWILGDQLMFEHPALAAAEAAAGTEQMRVVLVESTARIRQLPYQRKKLVLLLSAMRHFAEALRGRGYQVDYLQAESFAAGLRQHVASWGPERIFCMAASEFDTRRWQEEALAAEVGIPVTVLPNTQFLVGSSRSPWPPRSSPSEVEGERRRVVMETFYRAMRRQFGVLMTHDGEPVGGQWNFDAENRKPLPKGVEPPRPLTFPPDAVTRRVMAEVEAAGHGVGTAAGFDLAVTHEGAAAALDDFIRHRLPLFGPYEDAMSAAHDVLYHSVLSPYVNIGLLSPMQMIRAAEEAYRAGAAPINSVEGFVRQVLGWREYIYWQYWRLMPGLRTANGWVATRPMPAMFWDGETEMRCIRHVVRRVLATGYSHHIERLMVVCNFCLLAGVDPAAVAEWFLACYVDAYDWVVLPNVIGMGLNADGGQTATKPYIASANYIHKMSDYCAGCRFDPRRRTGPDACPYNFLYWNFLIEHEAALRANPRLGPAVLGLARVDEAERAEIRQEAERFLERLR